MLVKMFSLPVEQVNNDIFFVAIQWDTAMKIITLDEPNCELHMGILSLRKMKKKYLD